MRSSSRSRTAFAALLLATACHHGRGIPADATLAARARLLRIEDARADEPAWLDSALAAPDASTRAAAVLTAGRIGAVMHLPAMRRLVGDADTTVAASALFALGLMKDSASVRAATDALRGSRAPAREAAWLLGEVGERGRPALVAAIGDSRLATEVRGSALLALARGRPAVVGPVVPLLASADSGLAWRAAYVLARGRSAAAVRPLIAASTSRWPAVRDHAARGLARSLTGDSLGRAALAALVRLARDPDAGVRVTAVRVLGPYGAEAALPIGESLRDRDPGVRVVAASFAHLPLDAANAGWDQRWNADTAFAIRRTLAESALRLGRVVGDWQSWRTSADWQRRAAAAELDGRGPASSALPGLERGLTDRDGRVRAAAAGALAALTDTATVRVAARGRLRALLGDPDFVVRSTALASLARGAAADDLASAFESYRLALGDRDLDARLAFWELVDSTLTRSAGALPDSVERRLRAIERPAEPLERVRAARLARFAGWRDSAGTARALSWYEARARESASSRTVVARIETDRGVMELELSPADAPLTVHSFVSLASRRYFDGQRFHRVVPNFVVQGGDPRGDGNGGPGYAIRDELNRRRYTRGTVGMALSGPHTGGSQFFVTHSPQPHLDAGYTVFGQLRSGGEVLDRIVQGDRIVRITTR